MNAQRLKQIEEIFQAAIEIPIIEREDFFKNICDNDADLRREVESLLAFETVSRSFLDAPPEALAAEIFCRFIFQQVSILQKSLEYLYLLMNNKIFAALFS